MGCDSGRPMTWQHADCFNSILLPFETHEARWQTKVTFLIKTFRINYQQKTADSQPYIPRPAPQMWFLMNCATVWWACLYNVMIMMIIMFKFYCPRGGSLSLLCNERKYKLSNILLALHNTLTLLSFLSPLSSFMNEESVKKYSPLGWCCH